MKSIETVGFIVTVIGALPLLIGGVMDLIQHPKVIENTNHVGFPIKLVQTFGMIKILIGALILIPHLSLIGVILATGWMGGAIAAHVRVGDKFVIQTAIPIIIWVGFGIQHKELVSKLLGF